MNLDEDDAVMGDATARSNATSDVDH